MNCISKKNIVLFLIIIATISLGFKLYTVDFTVLPNEDTFEWVLIALAHNNGDFTEHPRKTLGWTIFVSPFFQLVDSNNFLDYVNITRGLSLLISIITIIPMYLLSRKFFDDKYSLCATALFAFEPHLNYLAWQGMTEPLYILVIILSMYFILNRNSNYSYLSFLAIGLLWWVRWQGIIMLLVVSILFFRNFKKTPKLFVKYSICLSISLIVVSPMLLDRYEQFGDPIYFSQTEHLFLGDYGSILAHNMEGVEYSAFNYIDDNGFGKFIEKFVLMGIANLIFTIVKMSFPYLIVLLPFGILFSLRAFDQEKKFIQSNWILILITLVPFVIYFAIIDEKRLIYYIFPFLILFAVIPLQRLVEYGLSTFSFTEKQKKLSLVCIMTVILILSGLYTLRYDIPDPILNDEKILFAETINSKFEGRILESGDTLQGLYYVHVTNPPGVFKNYKIHPNLTADFMAEFNNENRNLKPIELYAKSLEGFIEVSDEYELKYISINKNGVHTRFSYLSEIYENEDKFPYLRKVFDTEQEGFEKLKAKVFEIDYEKFYLIKNKE
jgi:hypothetical protein